jgi:NarL family two-component system response regulator LiaR
MDEVGFSVKRRRRGVGRRAWADPAIEAIRGELRSQTLAVMERTIRVLLVDDQRSVLQGLRMLLELEPDIEVVGEAEDGEAAVRMALEVAPDVVVMDIAMPAMDGIAATVMLKRMSPDSSVVIHSLLDDPETRGRAKAAGAVDFICKQQCTDALPGAIRRAASHGTEQEA